MRTYRLGAVLGDFIPAVDPEVQSAGTLPEKLRRAERDIVKDAREIRQEVRSVEERAWQRPEAGR